MPSSHWDEALAAKYLRPEDIARAVRFFLEPDGYATGQVLVWTAG